MDYLFYFILLFILIFGIISIYQDIVYRKVKNIVNLSFLLFCFLFFIFYFNNLILLDFILIPVSIFISYFIFRKGFWGAADGKIFIGLTLILISAFSSKLYLNYIVNLFLIYSLTIIILSQFKTSNKNKFLILKKKIKYDEILFTLFVSFIFISIIYNFIDVIKYSDFIFYILGTIFIFIYFLVNFTKKYYKNISKNEKNNLNIFLGFLLFFINFNNLNFIFYFIFIYIFRIFIEYISELADKIRHKNNKKYQSPFMIYLFLVSLLTILLQTNIILIIINFFT